MDYKKFTTSKGTRTDHKCHKYVNEQVENESISLWRTTDYIEYMKGTLQGDLMSQILFVLAANPLSFLLSREDGYKIGKKVRNKILSHLFFVDDLKLYASTIMQMKKLLDIVTHFTRDVGMSFGESKCAYQMIERGKRKEVDEPLHMNGLTIKEVAEGDHYTYLGVDESVGIDAPLNEDRGTREYKRWMRKVWNSELNKSLAHNTFAVAVLLPTFGILDWNKQEIKNFDIETRKIVTMSGSFHKASDVNRLYVDRKKGGRGLKNIEDSFEAAMIGLMEYLESRKTKEESKLMDKVNDNEQERIIRLGKNSGKESPM